MRNLRRPVLWVVLLLLALILARAVAAADTPDKIIRHVFGNAGQQVAAGGFILNGTLGEPIVGPFVSAGDLSLASGYWQGITFKAKVFLPIAFK